eukprot:jgi/Bigna1/147141/aug1.130_g21849
MMDRCREYQVISEALLYRIITEAKQILEEEPNVNRITISSKKTMVVLILFAFKILFPTSVYLNRGNHEATDMTEDHGFKAECLEKYPNSDV